MNVAQIQHLHRGFTQGSDGLREVSRGCAGFDLARRLLLCDGIMKTSFAALAVLATLAAAPLAACTEGDPIDDGSSSEEIKARPRFELLAAPTGTYSFQFVSGAGELLLESEDYSSRVGALGGLASVLANGATLGRYTLTVAADGKATFVLKANNGQTIAAGQTYATRTAASTAIRAAMASVTAYPKFWAQGTGARFEVKTDAGGKQMFNLRAANGQVMLTSERYDSLAAALNGAFAVVDHGVSAARYEVRPVTGGGYYLNLTATNGQIIATSEIYSTQASAERARDTIVALIPTVALL